MVDESWIGLTAVCFSVLGFASGFLYSTRRSKAASAGEIEITTLPDGNKTFSLNLNYPPSELADKSKVTFYITTPGTKT